MLINDTVKHRHRINNRAAQVFSSTETEGLISGADGITDLSIASGCPAVSFYFKSLLLQFLFNHSDFFTGETRHKVLPCNKAGNFNCRLEVQISSKHYSSLRSYLIILIFFTREARDIVPPCNTARIRVVYFKNNYKLNGLSNSSAERIFLLTSQLVYLENSTDVCGHVYCMENV